MTNALPTDHIAVINAGGWGTALAVHLGTQESTLRSHVTRLRARYREALREEVRHTVETDGEVDAELRELLRVLTAS